MVRAAGLVQPTGMSSWPGNEKDADVYVVNSTLKSANILLDELNPHLSDCGLAALTLNTERLVVAVDSLPKEIAGGLHPKQNNAIRGLLLGWFSVHEPGVTHVLVTGGAGYIGSHASLRLLKDSYRVTIVDNLSRGNMGAVKILQMLFPEPGRLQFIYADLGDANAVNKIFADNAFDAVMHFAAVAYVGESTAEPLRYSFFLNTHTPGRI
ncbi:hypothetical protein ACET3Z_010005 [Daucus carota]